ncbi:MAG: type II toxin-antitoxin system prevent-host-death family antitoxin [Candidatus Berkelbacteria bacterium]
MKSINVNELQNKISQVMREVEAGEVYQVSRYSKPVAFLVPEKEYKESVSGEGCKKCVEDLRRMTNVKIQNPNDK